MRFTCGIMIVLLAFIGIGCNKINDGNISNGTIRNNLPQPLHIDFYATREDYNNNANLLRSLIIPPQSELEIPAEFPTGTRLYIDWYSEDLTVSNWGNDPKFDVPNVTSEFGPILNVSHTSGLSTRKVWLGAGKASSVWEAYDYKNALSSFAISEWPILPEYRKSKKLTIRKDLTGTISYQLATGEKETRDFVFNLGVGGLNSTILFVSFGTSQGFGSTISQMPDNESGSLAIDSIFTSVQFPPEENISTSNNYCYRRVQ